MAGHRFAFDRPRRFVAGTVGVPGQRTFYLQAADGVRTVSVAVEKQQVALLAEKVDEVLDTLRRRSGAAGDIPPALTDSGPDTDPLDSPVEEEFRAVSLGIGWDDDDRVLVVEARSGSGEAGQSREDPDEDLLAVRLDPAAARAFAARGRLVVAAGRPPCPLCGQPLDDAHVCPRSNGHH